MDKVEETLRLISELLSFGCDNGDLSVIPCDMPDMTLEEYFGVRNVDDETVKRGIYVYELDESFSRYNEAIHYKDGVKISYFKL